MVRAIMTLSWIALVSAACGGAESSEFGDPAAPASSRPQGTPLGDLGLPVLGGRDGGGYQVTDGACVASEKEGKPIGADLYVMFDQSGSMATPVGTGTRLSAVRAAISEFLASTNGTGFGAGIGYFGKQPIGMTSCRPEDYAVPAVPIGALPGNAQPILDSLNSIMPVGETPTGSAIRGACGYAQDYQRAHPGHIVSLLLVTDGIPEAPVSMAAGCTPTLPDAVQAAADCSQGSPGVHTYVLGVGPSLQNLQQITTAGGTPKTYLVEGGDVSAQVLAALHAIRASASIPCELGIPAPASGDPIDPNLVNVVYTDGSGVATELYRVGGASECSARGGWYYDDAFTPHKIILCGATCDVVGGAESGRLSFALGCTTLTSVQ